MDDNQSNHFNEKKHNEKRALLPFLKRLLKYFLKYKKWFWTLLIVIVIDSVIEALLPLLWKNLIDTALPSNGIKMSIHSMAVNLSTPLLLKFLGLYAILMIGGFISERTLIIQAGRLRHYVIRDLRSEMFEKMQRLTYSYYDKTSAGWLVTRLTYDSERLSELMSWGIIDFVGAIVMISACIVAMLFCNITLTLIVLFIIPILLIISIRLRLMVLKYARESRRINSELIGYFTENLNAIEVVKSYAIEDYRLQGFQNVNNRLKTASFKTTVYSSFFGPVVVLVGSFVAGAILYYGGKMTFAGAGIITIGTFGAFFAYVRNIFMPIFEIARTYSTALSSLSAGERIFSLIDEPVAIKDHSDAITNFEIEGDIKFKDVFFGYLPNQKVLINFNLRIKKGESIALVGPSGEGKTTIVNLLCRFYEINSGDIFIDGVDLKKIAMHTYLNQIGIIPQVPHVFSGTIRDNICFSRPDAIDKEIRDVMKSIGAEDLTDRLNQEVGAEGESLSNGEKQMISFARAIIKKPRILIMDEATSSMDAITELRVRQSIRSIISGRTAIVIAHRLSTIKECDRIIFIQKGNISEQGSHDELLALKGDYYTFYKSYSRNMSTLVS